MTEEKKRVRRSNAEVREEKRNKYLKQIEDHKAAIRDLEQKIKELDKPTKTPAQIKSELMKEVGKMDVKQIAALLGKDLEELKKS